MHLTQLMDDKLNSNSDKLLPMTISSLSSSSSSFAPPFSENPPKRACDNCRRKKVKCHHHIYLPCCFSCLKRDLPCTYLDLPKPRGRRPNRITLPAHPNLTNPDTPLYPYHFNEPSQFTLSARQSTPIVLPPIRLPYSRPPPLPPLTYSKPILTKKDNDSLPSYPPTTIIFPSHP